MFLFPKKLIDEVDIHYSGYDAGFVFLADDGVQNQDILLFWQVKPVVHVFQVNFTLVIYIGLLPYSTVWLIFSLH